MDLHVAWIRRGPEWCPGKKGGTKNLDAAQVARKVRVRGEAPLDPCLLGATSLLRGRYLWNQLLVEPLEQAHGWILGFLFWGTGHYRKYTLFVVAVVVIV